MKMKRRLLLISYLLVFLMVGASCNSDKKIQKQDSKDSTEQDKETKGEATVDNGETKENSEIREVQVFEDRYFTKGLHVKSQTDGIAQPIGKITFDDTSEEPSWSLGQWYCGYYYKEDKELYDTFNILNAKRKDDGEKHTFIDASKKVSIDTKTGGIYMRLEASKEYTAPREVGQPWPHILFEYSTSDTFYLKDLKSLRFNMEYMVTKMENAFANPQQVNQDLHTAQFVFYIVVKNTNPDSKDFNNYIWFGLNLYDARWEIIPAYASQDSGKEVNTGAFIYQPISSIFCKYPTKIGEPQMIDYNLIPRIQDALNAAKQAGFLVNTVWEDLSLSGGNFGVEVTGTYDIAVDITKLDLWAGK